MIDSQRLLVHPYACGTFISAAVRILHHKTEIFVPAGTFFTGVQIFRDIPIKQELFVYLLVCFWGIDAEV